MPKNGKQSKKCQKWPEETARGCALPGCMGCEVGMLVPGRKVGYWVKELFLFRGLRQCRFDRLVAHFTRAPSDYVWSFALLHRTHSRYRCSISPENCRQRGCLGVWYMYQWCARGASEDRSSCKAGTLIGLRIQCALEFPPRTWRCNSPIP